MNAMWARRARWGLAGALGLAAGFGRGAEGVLVEAEAFAEKGGWQVDQQFTESMGSAYLLAHGLGTPVDNAATTAVFPEAGVYRLFVRTRNWVPGDWDAPGRFRVIIDGERVETVFGTRPGWTWQAGGPVTIAGRQARIELEDLTGFDGRCDAIWFSRGPGAVPPDDLAELAEWRRRRLGLPEAPSSAGEFDVVVVGGGIAGCAAAVAAGRQGLRVALVHDRPVLGGNASSEVRIHTLGIYGRGEDILAGLDTRHWPNGSAEAVADTAKRHRTMASAEGVRLFLCWRACAAHTEGARITGIDARHIESGEVKRFAAPVFIDCTGDGWIGYWAGADYAYGRESADTHGEAWPEQGDRWSPQRPDRLTMGASLLWYAGPGPGPRPFPEVPWAMAVAGAHRATAGGWEWEYASADLHQVDDAETIRDHLLRAIYGSFANAKRDPANANLVLQWVGYIAGKRESRRLVGDYVYTMADAAARRRFPDTVAEEQREIDVHHPVEENGFLARALYYPTGGIYYIPFRALYSRNIENLMMAGRCFSCSHIGLGGPRVMRTAGQMGIATGCAAALCLQHHTTPRGVYHHHLDELRALLGYAGGPEAP